MSQEQQLNRAARRQLSLGQKKQDRKEEKKLMRNTPNGNKFNSKKSRKVTPQATKKDGTSLIENPTKQQETPEIKHRQEEQQPIDNTNHQDKEIVSDIQEHKDSTNAFEESSPIEHEINVTDPQEPYSIENKQENRDNLLEKSAGHSTKNLPESIKDKQDITDLTNDDEMPTTSSPIEVKKESNVEEALSIKSKEENLEDPATPQISNKRDNGQEEKETPKKEAKETDISINESEGKDETTVVSNKGRTVQENIPTPSITTATTVSDNFISPSTSTSPSHKKKVNLVSKLFTKYKEGKKAKLLKSQATTTTTITTAVSTSTQSESASNNKKKKPKLWKVWKKL